VFGKRKTKEADALAKLKLSKTVLRIEIRFLIVIKQQTDFGLSRVLLFCELMEYK
jgi:hypothetical protein